MKQISLWGLVARDPVAGNSVWKEVS